MTYAVDRPWEGRGGCRVWAALAVVLLAGCAPARTPSENGPAGAAAPPPGAQVVVLYSAAPPPLYYRILFEHLENHGFRITASNDDEHTIETAFQRIEGGTLVQVLVVVAEVGEGSVARLTASWDDAPLPPTPSMEEDVALPALDQPAIAGAPGAAGLAFAFLRKLAREAPHERLRYERPAP